MSKNDGGRKIVTIHDGYLTKQSARDILDTNVSDVDALSKESRRGRVDAEIRDVDAFSEDVRTDDARIDVRDKRALRREVDTIRLSLDVLKDTLIMQQYVLARDFEARIRHVYDDVINDLNGIRKRVNDIGDTFESETKFKTWTPLMPIRKDVLPSALSAKSSSKNKLKGSKSVDFVDKRGTEDDFRSSEIDFDKFQSKKIFSQRQSWLGSSQSSISSTGSSRKLVPGFGGCFDGDGKTIPYRSYKARQQSNRKFRHSWGPSRSASRSTLDGDDLEDKGYLCGGIADDWRVKVAPYMWEGWSVPGVDNVDIHKLRDRMEHLELMRHEIVRVHNEYRQQHGCPELVVTTELAKEAQQWAELLAMRGFAQYNDSKGRGENILVVDIEDEISGRQVVDTWYRESRNYNYNRPGWQRGTTNFTQMIWKSSQFVGVGIAKFPADNTYVIVVQYQPEGNINTPAHFRQNVPAVIEKETPVFEDVSPLRYSNMKEKSISINELEDLKQFRTFPSKDFPGMNRESHPERDEIEKRIEQTETGSNNIGEICESEHTTNTMKTNTTDGLDNLVAGLSLVYDNLTKRKAHDFNETEPKTDMSEGDENEVAIGKSAGNHDSVDDNDVKADDDGIQEQNDVDDGIKGENDICDDDIEGENDVDDGIKGENDISDDDIEGENDVDGNMYNDVNDLIASVSASLASSVYDGNLADEKTITSQVIQQNREIRIAEQDHDPELTSGREVVRQSSVDNKVTSV